MRAGLATGYFNQCRRKVLQNYQVLMARAGLDFLRIAQGQRRTYALLVGEAALGSDAVLAEEIAVIAEEKYQRVIELAALLQGVE